jgi:hypothetical protein
MHWILKARRSRLSSVLPGPGLSGFDCRAGGNSMRFVFGFFAGIIVTGLLIDSGVNLPDRLGRLINGNEVQQLGKDIGYLLKR